MTQEELLTVKYAGEIIKGKFKHKVRIIKELFGKELSISDLSRKTGISYKETYRQTSDLKGWGILTRRKRIDEKHQPVMLTLTKKGNIFHGIVK